MTPSTASRRAGLLALVAVCAALLAGGLVWFGATRETATEHPAAVSAPASSAPGPASSAPGAPLRTIEYRGVRLDVPATWARADMSGCEFAFEQWVPPGSPPCRLTTGVAFYASATFDPAHGPGVRRGTTLWSGYVYAGDYAVYASGPERDLVRRVLDSAR